MKAKTIKAILYKKVNDWLKSIEDESLREELKKKVIVTGGCIASMLLREKVNDYDIYLRDREITIRLAEYYLKQFQAPKFKDGRETTMYVETAFKDRVKIHVKSAGIASEEGDEGYQYFEGLDDAQSVQTDEYIENVMSGIDHDEDDKPSYRPVFISSNAITLSDRVQIIIRFYGEPDEIHNNYDFVHCMNYWTSWDNELVLRPKALEALLTKELRYVGSLYPLTSIIRTKKFILRGWTINAGQYLKMVMQLNALDLNDVKVLEDQLVGVDVAYFLEVISKLKDKDPDRVDNAYLTQIIDKMF
jgi:hypothetical protein